MLTFVNDVWGARCGKTARWVLLGETRTRGHAYSVRASARKRLRPRGSAQAKVIKTRLYQPVRYLDGTTVSTMPVFSLRRGWSGALPQSGTGETSDAIDCIAA